MPNDMTAGEWLTSPAVQAELARLRQIRLAESARDHSEISRLREREQELLKALEACWLVLPTGCDRPDEKTCVVHYCAEDWPLVQEAEKRAGELLRRKS